MPKQLGFLDGFVGAGSFAGAAVDALVGVDLIGGLSGADCANGANICAGTAGDTKVGIDYSRHNKYSFVVTCFLRCKCRH